LCIIELIEAIQQQDEAMAKQFKKVTDLTKLAGIQEIELEAMKRAFENMFNIAGEWKGYAYYHNKKLTAVQVATIKGFYQGLCFADYSMTHGDD
jgi:hypothetical protein